MVAHAAHRLNAHIGTNAFQFLAQKANVHFYVVFYGIGVKAPHMGQDAFLRGVVLPGLHQQAHHIKFFGGKPHLFLAAGQCAGCLLYTSRCV